MSVEFKSRVAGRFYAEFYFYLAVFVISLYLALQHGRNPWVLILAVVAALFFVEMLFIVISNMRNAGNAFVRIDKQKIIVTDAKGTISISWSQADGVLIAWFSKDKWLENIFGLEPSILVRKKGTKKNEADLGISPDFFPTQKILVEMQRLYPKKIYFA